MIKHIIREIAVELSSIKNGTIGNVYLKPLTAEKAEVLLEYIAVIERDLNQRKTMDKDNLKMIEKYSKMNLCLEDIHTSKFPNTAAKADLLMDMAGKCLKEVDE